MTDLSVIIPGRNEMFFKNTIDNVLENIEGDTEIIGMCDGSWPDPPIPDNPRVTLVHHTKPTGQRASTNEGVGLSQAKYIMKLDAHCAVDKGFDVKLMANCEYDWTVIPRMYNLHAFNWVCKKCGHETYQGPTPTTCEKCDNATEFERKILWKPRRDKRTDYMWFDKNLHVAYFDKNYLKDYGSDFDALKQKYDHRRRDWAKEDITDVMCGVGACFFMHRERYWDLGGMDEDHGSWGQMAVEVACKAWLSGGRQVVNKKTWFAHMFRTQGGDFSFPFSISSGDIKTARKRSRNLWLGNTWPKAERKFEWIIEHFAPLPGWGTKLKKSESKATKGIVYYTDNHLEERIAKICRQQITKSVNGYPIVSVSHYPINFGENIVVDWERGIKSLFKQILLGLENINADIVFLCEHDVIYHPSHFEFTPKRKDRFYYNQNRWQVDAKTGQALTRKTRCTSLVCAYKDLLLDHFTNMVKLVEDGKYRRKHHGFAPGTHKIKQFKVAGVKDYKSEHPCIDIRHEFNYTPNRFKKEDYSKHSRDGWQESDNVPFWGKTKGRFNQFIREIL